MRFLIAFLSSFIAVSVLAQVPQGVGYQGVATDSEGIELVNQAISIRASILSGSVNGVVQWQEVHDTTTDDFGLFALTIGEGNNTGGGMLSSFADIPWGESTYFLQIEMDATGGMDYSLMGVNQMMSVPYALYAETSGNPGNPGPQGETGPQGEPGIQGPQGEQGPAGMDGEDAVLNYDTLAQYLSLDSSFVSTVTSNIGGGGCDFNYPDGLDGDPIIHDFISNGSYTVPTGKNLYVNRIFHNTGNDILINSMLIHPSGELNYDLNIILSEGDVISITTDPGNTPTVKKMFGFLVDKSVQSIVHDFVDSGAYTVPNGKNLYIYKLYHQALGVVVNSEELISNLFNNNTNSFKNHLILKAGEVIDVIDQGSGGFENMFGYLADEDYFADCGGGGESSDINSGSGDVSVSTFGDTLTVNGVSVIVPGVSYENVVPEFGTVTDIDGNIYNTIDYGPGGVWMTEDLNTTHYNNGIEIELNCTCGNGSSITSCDPGWCYYNSDLSNVSASRYYNGYTIHNNGYNVCPSGWHISSSEDWVNLTHLFAEGGLGIDEQYLSDMLIQTVSQFAYGDLSSLVESDDNYNIDNQSYLSLKLSGFNAATGNGLQNGSVGYYWTSDYSSFSSPENSGGRIRITEGVNGVQNQIEIRNFALLTDFLKIRCVQD
ncbi:MAG: hypothetical protein CL823_02355 [Crocinitomicaceae bacterium]|nr:hypothetical protein [Crocinitomicaceae bacterium]